MGGTTEGEGRHVVRQVGTPGHAPRSCTLVNRCLYPAAPCLRPAACLLRPLPPCPPHLSRWCPPLGPASHAAVAPAGRPHTPPGTCARQPGTAAWRHRPARMAQHASRASDRGARCLNRHAHNPHHAHRRAPELRAALVDKGVAIPGLLEAGNVGGVLEPQVGARVQQVLGAAGARNERTAAARAQPWANQMAQALRPVTDERVAHPTSPCPARS